MKKLTRLESFSNDLIAGKIDKNVEILVRNLESVLNNVETDIIAFTEKLLVTSKSEALNIKMALQVKSQLEQYLIDSGYFTYVDDFVKGYDEIIEGIRKSAGVFGYKLQLNDIDIDTLLQLKANDVVYFEHLGNMFTDKLYEGIYNSTLYKMPFKDFVKNLKITLANTGLEKYAYTYANTAIQRFDASLNFTVAQKTGWETYMYFGSNDKLTRPFCKDLLLPGKPYSRIYTIDEINKMDNGQGLAPVIEFRGGYNCRHRWQVVPPWFQAGEAS